MVDSSGKAKAVSAKQLLSISEERRKEFIKPPKKEDTTKDDATALLLSARSKRLRPAPAEPVATYAVAEALAQKLSTMIRSSKVMAHRLDSNRVRQLLELEEAAASSGGPIMQ